MANRLFIKLLLGFWLCSSLTLGLVAALPLLQQHHDRAPLPPNLHQLLLKISHKLQQNPELLTASRLRHWKHYRQYKGRKLRLYLVDENGKFVTKMRRSRSLRRFMLMAEEAQRPIRHQFKTELFFGPYRFKVNDVEYALYGQLPISHPKPWFLFFVDNKLLTLGLGIFFSGLLCSLLAWYLGKPLKQLKTSANKLAAGDFGSRVDESTVKRTDEMGQLAKAFNSMADSVESMMHQQQRLISDISHELRTPLTRLQLALAIAHKKGQQSSETERIGYESEQLEQLIAELLVLSKTSMDQTEKKQSLNLSDCLLSLLDDAEFEACEQDKQLHVQMNDEIEIALYPILFCRSVENILRNAIRYAEKHINFTVTTKEQSILIGIRDDGPGLPESELAAIFTPFYRPDSARDRNSGGWGLGLAIAKEAIAHHRGIVWAEMVSPTGLQVKIELPLQ
ncbi:HAMP domain-containing protein [Parashewanella spongiae]|uniref:histidine kinase n=1 Tax=Parashewanella spongiae TaxID=342950 RepID=A0A3A6T868_9GAMM|nr:ATP-binding protein [Parashewanella spongiae]MCL1079091.1 ATP-binding protein [Parashewanella spongiae]RJY10702.1 HAMP domain-containing protein [Parashewanella spongiae]